MRILGIESSCDETAAAIVENGTIRSSIIATQHDVHERFGGVVPELASRRHLENIVPVIEGALADAQMTFADLDGIAVTYAPGLAGSLLVGLAAAKGIAFAQGLPLIGVNHLEGHLNAAALECDDIVAPYVGLVVSGGHTSLYLVHGFGDYQLLGATRDDAAGEAFDKVAKLLGLGYPGGPAIDRAAERGNPLAFRFTPPKFRDASPFDFSFSGIKTAVLLLHKKQAQTTTNDPGEQEAFVCDLAASFQEAVVRILVDKVIEAATAHGAKTVVLAGGVAANRQLRQRLADKAQAAGIRAVIPPMALCTDNAAMIAHVGMLRLARGETSPLTLGVTANQEIGL